MGRPHPPSRHRRPAPGPPPQRRRTTRATCGGGSSEAPEGEDLWPYANASVAELVQELGPQAERAQPADVDPVLVLARREVEVEQVLQRDDLALHSDDLGHVRDTTAAVLEAGLVDDEVDRAGHLLADGPDRQV